jgi:hypothetical protein
MKRVFVVGLLLLLAATVLSAQGIYKADGRVITGHVGFVRSGQNSTYIYTDGTEVEKKTRQSGFSFSSLQIFPWSAEVPLNWYLEESFNYFVGGSESADGESRELNEASGLGVDAVFGVSTYVPQFLEPLHIMVGLGYHMDMLYVAYTYAETEFGSLESVFLDLSLGGLGLNVLGEYDLTENIAVNFGTGLSFDLYGASLDLTDALNSELDTIEPGVGPNFEIMAGVSLK